jgi:beta-lactamase class A
MILDKIKDRIGNFEGHIGICYMDLTTGENCNVGNCDVFPAEGMVKLLVLIEIFRRLEEGRMKKTDTYVLKKEDYPRTSERSVGALEHMHEGAILTMEDLYKLNCIVSDNMAFNILLKLVSKEAVNRTLQEYGFRKSVINRPIYDMEKIAQGIQNYISVQEMAALFFRMYKGQVISNHASSEILDILCYHQKGNILPYYFREKHKIAHQSSVDEQNIMDMGIVYGSHPFILCMASSAANTRNAESIMRDITLMCYKNSNEI